MGSGIVRRAGGDDVERVQEFVQHGEVERVRPERCLEPIAFAEVGDGHWRRTQSAGTRSSRNRLSVVVDGVHLRTIVEAARLQLPDDGSVRVGLDDLLARPAKPQERDVGFAVERVDPQRGAVRVLTEPAVPRRDGGGDLPARIERAVRPVGRGRIDDVNLGADLLVRPIFNRPVERRRTGRPAGHDVDEQKHQRRASRNRSHRLAVVPVQDGSLRRELVQAVAAAGLSRLLAALDKRIGLVLRRVPRARVAVAGRRPPAPFPGPARCPAPRLVT